MTKNDPTAPPVITYVLPCLNEAAHLPATLSSLQAQEGIGGALEVIVVDGGSSDGSPDVVEHFAQSSHARIRVVENPRRSAASGFNLGVTFATADVVVLGGARTVYPKSHAADVLDAMRESGAAVVGGGVSRFLPARDRALERAIAALYASPVGAGAAAYHRRRTPGEVDTVYCGAYRRDVLERVGGVDERFTRAQDAELNSRIRRAGYRVWFDPRLSTDYQFRGGFKDAMLRAFRTGQHIAAGWRMQPHSIRLRHLAPLCWTVFLIVAPLLPMRWLTAPVGALYLAVLAASAFRLTRRIGVAAAALTVPVFAAFHVAYGVGQIRGLLSGKD